MDIFPWRLYHVTFVIVLCTDVPLYALHSRLFKRLYDNFLDLY